MSYYLALQVQTLKLGRQGWESQETLMDTASRELGSASVASLPPSVQGAASTFFTKWAGYAEESAAIAQGFVGALQATENDYNTAEDAADRLFSDLDGRLGPSR